MKKISFVIVVCIIFSVFLCSCHLTDTNELCQNIYYEEISKTQKITIISADTYNTVATLSSKEELTDFINALDIAKWELKSLPQDAEKSGILSLSQEKTLMFGQSTSNRKLHNISEIYSYKAIPYVTLKTSEISMSFKVTKNTAEYLNTYFE